MGGGVTIRGGMREGKSGGRGGGIAMSGEGWGGGCWY